MPNSLLAKLLVFALLSVGGAWLSGIIFYAMNGINVNLAKPWTIITSFIEFKSDPRTFKQILISVAIVLAICFIGLVLFWKYKFQNRKQFGNARFATEKEISKAGLREAGGLVFGQKGGKYLTDNGQTHVLVAAPTGSGKGVGVVIPNLLNWNGSAVVLDIKGENYELTSGFRQQHGQDVYVFSPFSTHSHRFNPFDAITPDPRQRFNDIQNIANIILPDNEKDPTWSQQGRALFVAFAIYLLDKEGQVCTIGNILRFLQTTDDTRDVVKAILEREGDDLDAAAQRTFAGLSQQEKRMSESVKVGLVGALSLWNSSSIDAATSATDFDIAKLRAKKTTIYVVVSLADLSSLRPLLTLFFEQVFAAQLRQEPQPNEPNKVLFLLDEFESLGTMNGIVDKLPFVRSFNVRILAIIQGLSQLDQRYTAAGRDKILQGSKHQIFFASNDQQTTQYVSDTLGKTTIHTTSRSVGRQGRTKSRQGQARELMLPQEVRELSPERLILITEGTKPIQAKKLKYYEDKNLKSRTKISKTSVPKLDTDPKFSPTLEEIAGPEIAERIRNERKTGGAPAPANKAPAQPKPNFDDMLKSIKSDKNLK